VCVRVGAAREQQSSCVFLPEERREVQCREPVPAPAIRQTGIGLEEHGEPGVFMCIEEREQDLAENVASLGFDLPEPMRKIIGDLSNTERTLIGLQLRPVRVGKPRQT